MDYFDKYIEETENTIQNGKGVVYHCMAGLSRTGMALGCYLVRKEGFSPTDAIRLVNQTRGKGKGSVMTFKQEDYVKNYFETKK